MGKAVRHRRRRRGRRMRRGSLWPRFAALTLLLFPVMLFACHTLYAPQPAAPSERRTEVSYSERALLEAAERITEGAASLGALRIKKNGVIDFSLSADFTALSGTALFSALPSSLQSKGVRTARLRVQLTLSEGAFSLSRLEIKGFLRFRPLPTGDAEALLANFFTALAAESGFVPRGMTFARGALTLSG